MSAWSGCSATSPRRAEKNLRYTPPAPASSGRNAEDRPPRPTHGEMYGSAQIQGDRDLCPRCAGGRLQQLERRGILGIKRIGGVEWVRWVEWLERDSRLERFQRIVGVERVIGLLGLDRPDVRHALELPRRLVSVHRRPQEGKLLLRARRRPGDHLQGRHRLRQRVRSLQVTRNAQGAFTTQPRPPPSGVGRSGAGRVTK